MAVYVVQGKLGSGKSAHMTSLIAEHLVGGGVVATNMRLHLDAISRGWNRRLDPRQYIPVAADRDPATIPRGDFRGRGRRRVMVVLDEALNWFASKPAGAKDSYKDAWSEWLRQSDKLGQDVYFIAQNFERAAKWIRELAVVLFSIVNFGNLTFLRMPFGRWFHWQRFYGVTRVDIRSGTILGWSVHFLEKRVFDSYETAELYGFSASDNAYDLVCIAPPFRLPAWPVKLTFLVVLVVGVWLCVV